jgi:hypothetical protein
METRVNFRCEEHLDPFDCADNLVIYSPRFDEYGLIIHDGGHSYVLIEYCPWSGTKLPDSKRDQWFDRLKELGFDNPLEQDIPKEFLTEEWYTS